MTDPTSASAKEMLFRKDRVFTEPQRQWLELFMRLTRAVGSDRILKEKCRNILLLLQVPRGMLRNGLHPCPLPREEVVDLFAKLRPVPFTESHQVWEKIREIAKLFGVNRSELRTLF